MDVEKSAAWQFRHRPRRRLVRYVAAFVLLSLLLMKFSHVVHNANRFTQIQHAFDRSSTAAHAQTQRLAEVRSEFLHAWNGYKSHAWKADALAPVTGTGKTQFCGWSATLVDTLDTLWIMDLKDEFNKAVEAMIGIDFVSSAALCEVNMFESTIRYLGGMLAAYDLSQDQRLLPKIMELGGLLNMAFNTVNGMPCNHCRFDTKNSSRVYTSGMHVPLADMASFYLEFARLSQVAQDQKFMQPVEFVTQKFERLQDQSVFPGLWPDMVNAESIDSVDGNSIGSYSLGALSDSAYEYLVKSHLMLGGLTSRYKSMWSKAASAIRGNLLFRAYIPQWNGTNVLFSGIGAQYSKKRPSSFEPRTQHLACFAGGMFAMASRIFNRPSDLLIGEGLTNGCVWAYDQSPLGIMPETFSLLPCPNHDLVQCEWNATAWSIASDIPEECIDRDCDLWQQMYPTGYLNSLDEHYGLRPEAIESVFIMFRITGDERWRDIGWRMFKSIIKNTRTKYGHAALDSSLRSFNVTVFDGKNRRNVIGPSHRDEMESFWLAETLKYFWLLFSDTDLINLDEWVLNTEAHPLKLSKGSRGFP